MQIALSGSAPVGRRSGPTAIMPRGMLSEYCATRHAVRFGNRRCSVKLGAYAAKKEG